MRKPLNITKMQVFILLFLIALFALSASHIVRSLNKGTAMIGDESYYHARIARQIVNEGMPSEDNFVYNARKYPINPYHIVLAGFSYIFGVIFASQIVPFVSGILSLLVFYLILKNLGFSEINRITICSVFILSPIFIYIFSLSTPFCVSILLGLVGFYLFIQKEKKLFIASIGIFIIASFFGFLNILIILALTFSYVIVHPKERKRFYVLALFLSAVFLLYYVNLYFSFGTGFSIKTIELGLVQNFITDFGGFFGFSIFALLLAGLGLAIVWENKKKLYYAYLIMLAVIGLSFFYSPAAVYSNFIISILAGITLAALIRRKWEIKVIRNLSITLLFCGLLFSAVSYTIRVSNHQPNPDMIDALEWIKYNSGKEDMVFSHHANGFWIQFQAERPVLADSLAYSSAGFLARIEDSSSVFSSWNIEETRKFLTKYNVTFILITQDMAEGLVWDKPDQGLAYLMRNSETFKKEYSNSYARVWRYIYTEND